MTLPKLLALVSLILFGAIGIAAIFKSKSVPPVVVTTSQIPLEVELDQEIQLIAPALAVAPQPVQLLPQPVIVTPSTSTVDLPEANRIEEFFNKNEPKFPIVETVTYKSRVTWQKGRPAWLSDYASHYDTSRHFIARSLNGKPDYLKQELAEGDRFNVLRKDKNIQFYLLIDTSRCKMWFYYLASDERRPVLVKTYAVGLGRLDSSCVSGLLTPLGKYSLGDRIATYKPKATGIYHGKKAEMVTIFGTRWIPFEEELSPACTAPAKGFGIHGTPWEYRSGEPVDNTESIGKYESDGCIRLATPDIEELFSIIITKPTTIEIVRDFADSTLVGLSSQK